MPRMRTTLVWLHRWIGLTVGLLFALICATAVVVVFENEIDEAVFGPAAPQTTPGRISVDDAIATIRAARPAAELVEVAFPPAREGVNAYRVTVRPDRWTVDDYVDAGSGERVFFRPPHPLLQLVRRIHVNLAIGRPGFLLVVGGTAVGIPLLLLGLVVWWPRGGRWRNGFRIRWRKGTYPLNYDLHQVTGLFALPLLVALSVSGLLIVTPGVTDAVERWLHGAPPAPLVVSVARPESDTPRLGYEALAERVAERTGGEVTRLRPGADPDDPVLVGLVVEGSPVEVAADPFRGTVLASRDLPAGRRFDRAGVHDFHVGHIGGMPVKILLAVSSLVGALLFPTGVIMWWIRRQRRARLPGGD